MKVRKMDRYMKHRVCALREHSCYRNVEPGSWQNNIGGTNCVFP